MPITGSYALVTFQVTPPDATPEDSLKNRRRGPSFFFRDRYGDPFSNPFSTSPFSLDNPGSIKLDVQADSGGNVLIQEKIGDLNYRQPSSLSFDEFSRYQDQRLARDYWKSKAAEQDGKSEVAGRGLIPKIYLSPVFDRIFGGNYVDFKTNGFVNLDFGGRFQRVANPSIPIRQQRSPYFDFDQQVSLNVIGQVGEKMKITANFDTKASFQFEQNLKLEYTGFEEDIIQKIEAGNVSMPLNSTLITGVQNLFGIKTQLRFGRLTVTGILANQRASLDQVNVQGGVQTRRFEVKTSDYEDNRHFFLGQYFRGKYEPALRTSPVISSGVTITRLEVYITNRNNNTQTLRNIMALADLGEANPRRDNLAPRPGSPAANGANELYARVVNAPNVRNADAASGALEGLGLVKGTDFELLRASRKLSEQEYTFQPELGYLSLNTPLRNDEVLAVAYEYTLNGRKYKVGELTEDYQNRDENEVIILKLLKPSTIQLALPIWNLMMKNIYSLGAGQINRQGFQLRVIYKDDLTGIDNPSLQEGRRTKDVPLVQLFGLDRLNPQGDPQVDGNFDWVEGITIDSQNGRIIFPVLEPFGQHLADSLAGEQDLINKYAFTTLYRSTKQEAQQVAAKNKFFIKGSYQSSASNNVSLPSIGADGGSATVTANGVPLVEGQDYVIEGQNVTITNESLLNSNADIQVQYEKPDLFNNQQRFLSGVRLDYQLGKDFIVGSTLMHLKEKPIITRVGLGNEPTNNTIVGFDASIQKDSRFLTRMVDKLPLLETKELSTINFAGEYARLFPGVAPLANNNSFIDDFEGAETPFDLTRTPQQLWKLGATPLVTPSLPQFAYSTADPLSYTYRRAKLAWYSVDNIFYRNSSNISEEDRQNNYFRAIAPQEVSPGFSNYQAQTFESVFDLAYFPSERGMYNYTTDLNPDGTLRNPENSWAALTRPITYDIDFDNANIQYVEFWLMDPFLSGANGRAAALGIPESEVTSGGDLFLNLGSISEDVMKDGRHAFENGLPTNPDNADDVAPTTWGRVTTQQFLTNAFENTAGARQAQDIGLDGLNSTQENEPAYFNNYVNRLPNLNPDARTQILQDPSSDDFAHFLDERFDAPDVPFVQRFKNFNGMENNSPEADNNPEFTRSNSTLPNNEDLNTDNTINDIEGYYQYRISMRPQDLRVGSNYIVDQVTNTINGQQVSWYQFRIPIREFPEKVGNIEGFKSIRFMRMFVTNFQQPVILRFSQYQLVSNQWRVYGDNLFDTGLQEPLEPYDARATLSTVNIEENGQDNATNKVRYVLPPGFQRDRDITTQNNRQLNEQSIKFCVDELRDRDARAVFKNVGLDLINYQTLRMFLHADSQDPNTQDGEVTAFVRIGTDFVDNYYEIEVPLTITPFSAQLDTDIWPEENEINLAFDELRNVKANRNSANFSLLLAYTEQTGRYNVSVKGNPDLSSVQTLMIGVRNPAPAGQRDQLPKSVCIWADELRTSGFDQESGWATTGRASIKLADFATITASGSHVTYGFGGVQQRISERAREYTTEWNVASNVNLEKMLPSNWGLKIPMYLSYERERITPRFNPLDPDMPLDLSLDNLRSDRGTDRSSYRKLVEDNTTRRSINFTNVRKERNNPEANVQLYDIENFSLTYAYSDIQQTNINTESYLQKNVRGGLAYTYTNEPKYIEPFKNISFLKSPFLKWLQDFNFSLAPSSISLRGDLNRTYTRTQLRSADLGTAGILPTFEKYFTFDRLYDVKWNLTRSLVLDYTASANAVIDEPRGEVDGEEVRPGFTKRDSVIANLKKLGRMKNFSQRASITYRLPLDKFPLTDWVQADVRYGTSFNWLAASLAATDTLGFFFGNTLQNSRERAVNGRIDLTRLYNKVKFLKDINTPPARATPNRPPPPNRSDTTNRADTLKKKPELKVIKGVLRVLMSARSITGTYSLDESTQLAGFLGTPRFFGNDSSFSNPGAGFTLLGSQDADIRYRLRDAELLSRSTSLNTPFTQSVVENITLRTNAEPFRDFKIQIDARRQRIDDYQEFYRLDSAQTGFVSQSPLRSGSYDISFVALATTFKTGEVFQEFERNRSIIRSRLQAGNPASDGYGLNSQDVLIPAFIAAYSGKEASSISLSPFPKIPLPNWRVDYAGLSRLELFKSVFSSVNITHSYTSNYAVSNYTSSLEYGTDVLNPLQDRTAYPRGELKSDSGLFIPVYVLSQVAITERFAPLIGVNVRTISKITARIEYNQERNLLLSMSSSAQFTEQTNRDIVVGIGFTKNNVRVPFKSQGKNIVLKNDLNFRCDFALRDSKTVQRTLDEGSTVTAGNLGIQLKPTINYVLNQRLNLQMYFERSINEPQISSSYRRTNTNFGFQLRYNLSQ